MIRDFVCKQQAAQLPPAVVQDERISFPAAYCRRDEMVRLAEAVKTASGAPVCILPFCHTVEAEALGAHITYGDQHCGPRAGQLVCSSIEEFFALPKADCSTGRIAEVLAACKLLSERGETVILEISGPLTILNALMEPHLIFRALRKQPQQMNAVWEILSDLLLDYVLRAEKAGAIISFADPIGSVNILGPKLTEQLTKEFTWPFLLRLARETRPDTLVSLCPKTALALIGSGCATWESIPLPRLMSYPEALLEARGKTKFTGQVCLKNPNTKLPGSIRGLRLQHEERNLI